MTDEIASPASPPLGRVVATERKPNTPHEFHFWTALDSPVGIGTIVRVDGAHAGRTGTCPQIYGIVVEGFSYTDLMTPIHDVLGHDGTPGSASLAATQRAEIRLYTARGAASDPRGAAAAGADGRRSFSPTTATSRSRCAWTAISKEGSRTGIPVGVYRAGGTDAPIYLDADFLIGPEAAHLNITGVSGLATKTSAIEWIMSSIFTHFPEQKGSIASIALQRQRTRPLLPRPARRDRRRGSPCCTRSAA